MEVLSEGEYWRKFGPEGTECYEDIMDWNPRMIRLILSDSEKFKEEGIEVNLSTFEFLCRLSSGLTMKGEHLASFNRIEDRLMSWSTEKEPDPDEPITVCPKENSDNSYWTINPELWRFHNARITKRKKVLRL